MYASELIRKLTDAVAEYGDLPIENEYGHVLDTLEFNDDEGKCLLVSFSDIDPWRCDCRMMGKQ
jgi:hypothetical protein